MDIELGIQNVARPVNFSTDESADNVSQAIAQAVADNTTIDESRISGLGHYLKAAFVLLNHRYSGSTPR